MLEFHPAKFFIDSLNNYLGGLVEFLSSGLLAGLASFLDQLHHLLFFKFPRELALRIDLIVLFLAMRLLISLKDMLDNLITGSTSSFVACNG